MLASGSWGLIAAAILVLIVLFKWINVLREYERGVVFRLGRVLARPKGPGLVMVLWPIDRMLRVSLRTEVESIPAQDVITRDNVSVKVNAVLYFRVIEPIPAIINVKDYLYGTSQLAQTTLRSVLGTADLDDLLAERDKINLRLQEIIDRQTEPWGVKVATVEIKDVDLPEEMRRAMARQAMAEREKRGKIIHAEGEFQASERLAQAAKVMRRDPMTLQLRYLQTLVEVSGGNKTIVVPFPLPLDTLTSLFGQMRVAPNETSEAPPREEADAAHH
jgi:regulator of protease activity HflC (stomatin/prohibitin superfamily)